MTVEHVQTEPAPRLVHAGRAPVHAPALRRPRPTGTAPLCLVLPEVKDGEGPAVVRTLRRRESTHAVLLTRRAGRRELLVLLAGGVRGVVVAETAGAVRVARPPEPEARPDAELTAREIGVLRLVADGHTNRGIGEQLELSALTVKSHLARISRKVGTGDRAEMVAYAIRHDLLN